MSAAPVSAEPRQPAPERMPGITNRPIWVAWRLARTEGGNLTKEPINPRNGRKGSSTDSATWAVRSIAEACAKGFAKGQIGGIGLVLGLHDERFALGGVDLDTCRSTDNGEVEPWAIEIVQRFGSYAEISPSGTGLKVFFQYGAKDLPELRVLLGGGLGKHWKRPGKNHPPGIELYLGGRFFTLTDNHLAGSPSDIRLVGLGNVRWLAENAGPNFVGPASPNHGQSSDNSRSGIAFREGRRMRQEGATFEEMCDGLRNNPETAEWVRSKGDLKGGRELTRIWEKAEGGEPGEIVLDPKDPLTIAEKFVESAYSHAGLPTIRCLNREFYIWEGTQFRQSGGGVIETALYGFLKNVKQSTGKGPLPFQPDKTKVERILHALQSFVHVSPQLAPPCMLDGSPMGDARMLACQNGVLVLGHSEIEFRHHTPNFFNISAIDFDYNLEAPEPGEWLAFLRSIWPDDQASVDALQEIFGAIIAGDRRYQKIYMLVGPPRSGKGTIAGVLKRLVGPGGHAAPSLASLARNFGLQPLINKTLAIVPDARFSGPTSELVERLLAISGGDSMDIDIKHKEAWTGVLPTQILFLTNEVPSLVDSSTAITSRFIILNMDVSHLGREDLGLENRLRPELPSILNWAIRGWQRLNARGFFIEPESSQESRAAMEELASPIKAFVDEWCEIGVEHRESKQMLFEQYRVFCESHGREHPGNTAQFGRALKAAFPSIGTQKIRTTGGRDHLYTGICLRRSETINDEEW